MSDKTGELIWRLPRPQGVFLLTLIILSVAVTFVDATLRPLFGVLHEEYSVAVAIERDEGRIVDKGLARFELPLKEPLPNTFEEIIWQQNPALQEAVARLDNQEADIVFVHAPAGYGKTGLLDKVVELSMPKDWPSPPMIKLPGKASGKKHELFLNGKEVNELPALAPVDIERLLQSREIDSRTEGVVILDGADELHPISIPALIKSLKLAQRDNEWRRDVLLFARPEVVDGVMKTDNTDSVLAGVQVVEAMPQDIRRNTLHLRAKNYLDYKAMKHVEGKDEVWTPATLVPGINDAAAVEKCTKALLDEIGERPYLVEMLRLAALSKLWIDHVLEVEERLGTSDEEIRRNVLARVLKRNQGSHGRPPEAGTDYFRALVAIAATVTTDEDGFFVVPEVLGVKGARGEVLFDFEPYGVLQRSGVVSLKPAKGNARFRFEPIWLQSELARYSGELTKGLSVGRVGVAFLALMLAAYCSQIVYDAGKRRRQGRRKASEAGSSAKQKPIA